MPELSRRLARDLLDKYESANTHYIDPADVDHEDETVNILDFFVHSEC